MRLSELARTIDTTIDTLGDMEALMDFEAIGGLNVYLPLDQGTGGERKAQFCNIERRADDYASETEQGTGAPTKDNRGSQGDGSDQAEIRSPHLGTMPRQPVT